MTNVAKPENEMRYFELFGPIGGRRAGLSQRDLWERLRTLNEVHDASDALEGMRAVLFDLEYLIDDLLHFQTRLHAFEAELIEVEDDDEDVEIIIQVST